MGAADTNRGAVHLYSWFIEPICARTSKRWNGNVRVWGLQTPSSTTWWRSSSIAIRNSSTQLTTRFGTNVVLHGTLCETYASRVHMNAVGVDMFRNGFPSQWKPSLQSSFSKASSLKWNQAPKNKLNKARANKTVSILKKSARQQQPGKRKRVRFDVNLRPVDVPCPPSKRPRVTFVRADNQHAEQPPSKARTRSKPPRSVFAAAPNVATPKSPHIVPKEPYAVAVQDTNASKPVSSKAKPRARRKRNASGRATNDSNSSSESQPSRGRRAKSKSPASTKRSSHDGSNRSTLVAIPIANSSDILNIRRSKRIDAEPTLLNARKASSQPTTPTLSKKKQKRNRSNSVPPKPKRQSAPHAETPKAKRTRSSSVPSKRVKASSHDPRQAEGRRRRRRSSISEYENEPKLRERRSSPAHNTPARAETNKSKTTHLRTATVQSKLNATSDAKPLSEPRRRSRRLSEQLSVPTTKSQTKALVESNSKNQSTHPVTQTTRRSKRILDQSSKRGPKPVESKLPKKDEVAVPSRRPKRAQKGARLTDDGSEKENSSREDEHRSPKHRKAKRGRPRGSVKKTSLETQTSKTPPTGEQEAEQTQTRRRRSTRVRIRPDDTKNLPTKPTISKKRGATGSSGKEKVVGTGTNKQMKCTKKTESKACARTESKPHKASVVQFAKTNLPTLRPRRRVSFGPEFKSDDSVPAPQEGLTGSWSAKQREDFEKQRNSVPANDPNYWELIAAGVEGKTAAQCLELWESSWSSPPCIKRKKVGFADVESEPRTKKPKMSTPQVIQNVQKASKSKRGRNTAKYRTSVRRLADTFARDTEDDALEPEIVTPKMSWKLSSGRANMPNLGDGTPGTEVRQKRRNAEKGGELETPEILKRGKSFGLREADLYVSLFRRRLGAEPIVPTSKQVKPGVMRNLAKKPPLNVAKAFEPAVCEDGTSLSDAEGSQDSDSSCDGDLFF